MTMSLIIVYWVALAMAGAVYLDNRIRKDMTIQQALLLSVMLFVAQSVGASFILLVANLLIGAK